jgi:protease-4
MIQEGKSTGGSLLGEAVMGSDTVIKDLRAAEKDPTVKAIVLRVDSPGGSALASDLIWREVTRIEKPIVASMSDVAASGGYYISMGADKILAEPGTLTGSIGVIGGKVALGGLMEKFGVTTDTITVGKNATMFSYVKPFSDDERAAMQRLMKETYTQFVSKAATGRKMKFEELEKLARGRVYTGRQAKGLGLVDEIGTVKDAIAEAKSLAGLDRDAEIDLLILPEPQGLLESLFAPLDSRDTRLSVLLPEPLQNAAEKVERIGRLLNREPAVLLLPFEMRIR